MSLIHSPSVVTSGLIAAFDAENLKSYGGVNLIANSNSFSTAGWNLQSVTATANAGTGPYGESATRIAETATTAQHLLMYALGTVISGETFTWSASFKPENDVTQVVLHTFGEGTVVFFLTGASAGTVASGVGGNTLGASITSEPNGWFRCSATFRKANTTGSFYISNQQGLGAYLGVTARTYLICNAQIQTSRAVTEYRATTGTAGSRTVWTNQVSTLNGTLVNSPYYDGQNRGMTFNGTTNAVSLGTSFLPRQASDIGLTLSVWIRPTRLTNFILGRAGNNSNYGDYSLYTNNGTIGIGMYSTASGSASFTYSGTISINTWTNITFSHVYGTTASTIGAINGVATSLTTSNGTIVPNQAGNAFEIGHWYGTPSNGNSSYWFEGSIGIVQIYDRALSAAEVLRNFNATKGRYGL